MNQQEIQERITTISNEITSLKTHYVKLEGHLAEAQYWLAEFARKELESPPDDSQPGV